jgi:hypothetical protein
LTAPGGNLDGSSSAILRKGLTSSSPQSPKRSNVAG